MLILFLSNLYSQSFMNGSFENTTATVSCQYNLDNITFNGMMPSVNAYGGGNECDILINGCFNTSIPDGIRAVGISGGGTSVDEISLNLSIPLIAGNSYTVSFWSYSETTFRVQGDIEVGASTSSSFFGTSIYTAATVPSTWTNHTFTFIAPNNTQYITVRNVIDGIIHWNHIDNFELVNCLPNLNFGNDTILCQGETLTLDASAPNTNYLWQDNSTNPTFTVTQPGTYWVQATNNCGSTSDTINVDFMPVPTINLGNDTSLCSGELLVLNASIQNATYLWSTNSTDSILTINQSGNYWVQATNNCGSISDTINVNFIDLPVINLGNDTSLCYGELLVLDVNIPNAAYLWNNSSTDSTLTITEAGSYWVIVTKENCNVSDTINISYKDIAAPPEDFGLNQFLKCKPDTILLNVSTPTATYLWNDGSSKPFLYVTEPGDYWVEVFTLCNSFKEEISISKEGFCDCELWIPNTFTPDNDGYNDVFTPSFYNCEFATYSLSIYNRWGEFIFETTDPHQPWNGLHNSIPVPDGIYIYKLSYSLLHDSIINKKHGKVAVLR